MTAHRKSAGKESAVDPSGWTTAEFSAALPGGGSTRSASHRHLPPKRSGVTDGSAGRGVARTAFTLVELLVSAVLIVLLLMILVSMTDSTRKTWATTNAKIEEFRGAREGFETITRRLSDATLNTYWDYDDAVTPTKYVRQSELRFLSGPGVAQIAAAKRPTHAVFFQAPLGFVTDPTTTNPPQLLNTWGYFVEYSDDSTTRPPFMAGLPRPPPLRARFRLMELMEPSEKSAIYSYTSGFDTNNVAKCLSYNGTDWFTTALGSTAPLLYRPVAENIVALVILPRLAPGYLYYSTGKNMSTTSNKKLNPKNQLPPIMQVAMVAVSESSYLRSHPDTSASNMPDFYSNSPFTDATAYAADLQALTKTLGDAKAHLPGFHHEHQHQVRKMEYGLTPRMSPSRQQSPASLSSASHASGRFVVAAKRAARDGFAIVIVLSFLALILVLVLAFFLTTATELDSAKSYA